MRMNASKVIKLLSVIMDYAKRAGIPKYSSKFSPRKYNQHQLICLLALKKLLKQSYRDIVDMVSTMDSVMEFLELDEVPHFTTLQKAFQRLWNLWLLLVIQTKPFSNERLDFIAIDSSGFSDRHSSYYRKRLEDFGEIRGWKKVAIAVDREGYVMACYFAEGNESDFNHMKHLLRQLMERGIRFRHVIADKGYDSSKNRQLIRDHGGKAIIPVRHMTDLHEKADKEFMEKHGRLYAKRNIVESVFSAMKRRFGGEIWSRKEELKFKELLLVVVVYNAWKDANHAKVVLFFMEVFYKA